MEAKDQHCINPEDHERRVVFFVKSIFSLTKAFSKRQIIPTIGNLQFVIWLDALGAGRLNLMNMAPTSEGELEGVFGGRPHL